MILSKLLPAFLFLFLLTGGAQGQEAPDIKGAREVFEAEKAFARDGFERGIRESFLKFFADDSVLFAPGPTNGKAFYEKFAEKGRRLIWGPSFATISNSGEMGVTTGPWHLEKSNTDNEVLGYGEFATIWKRQANKEWKVALDIGIEHPKPPGEQPKAQLLAPAATRKPDKNAPSNESALANAEKIFLEALAVNELKALIDSASSDLRVLRDGAFPVLGKEAVPKITGPTGKVTRTNQGGGISDARDLAYRYGSYVREAGGKTDRGYFFSVWQFEQTWRLLLDLHKKKEE
jgi:ketosteroid isomerase-like protein